MPTRRAILAILIFPLLAPLAGAAGKKNEKFSISFHLEAEATDNPKMIFQQMVGGRAKVFKRVPEIHSKDIASFAPFPTADGDYGLVLRLHPAAVNRIHAVTTANQGRWLVALVNGRVADAVLIDKPVSDGRMVIWKRVMLADITLMDEVLPRIGKEQEKKKKKSFF